MSVVKIEMPYPSHNLMLQAGASLGAPVAGFFLIQVTPAPTEVWKPLFDTGVIGCVFALSCWLIKDLLRRLDSQSTIHQARLEAASAQHQADLKQHAADYRALVASLDQTMRQTLEERGRQAKVLEELQESKFCIHTFEEAERAIEAKAKPRR